MLITGIANPFPLQRMLSERQAEVATMRFNDHHRFSKADVKAVNRAFIQAGPEAIAVTTEKDAARLRFVEGLEQRLKERLYAIPLSIDFIDGQKEVFNTIITRYVKENRRNG